MAWYQNYGAAKALMQGGHKSRQQSRLGGVSSFSCSYSSAYDEYRIIFVVTLVAVVVIAAALVANFEDLSTLDAIYFTWATLTTVGYGDIFPTSAGGQATVVFVGMLGLAILSLLITIIADASARRVNNVVARLAEAGTADPYVQLRNEPVACAGRNGCAMPGGPCCLPRFEWCSPCARHAYKTPVVPRSLHPLWNQVWVVDTDALAVQQHEAAPAFDDAGLILEFEVLDYDVANADDRIGFAFLAVADVAPEWRDFEARIVLDDDIEPLTTGPPTLHLSARCLPGTSCIEVVVIGAVNLPVMDDYAGRQLLSSLVSNALEPTMAVLFSAASVLIGGAIFSFIEDWRYFDGIYWAFVTVNAVGFGDFAPTKDNSRLLFIPFTVLGLAARGYAIGVVSNAILTRTAASYVTSADALHGKLTQDDIDAANNRAASRPCCACWYGPSGIFFRHMMAAVAVLAVSVLLGSLIYLNEPEWTWGDGVYFCFITLSQVGYGDFVPTNDGTKGFVIVYSVLGTFIVSITIAIISKSKVDEAQFELQEKRDARIRDFERSLKVADSEAPPDSTYDEQHESYSDSGSRSPCLSSASGFTPTSESGEAGESGSSAAAPRFKSSKAAAGAIAAIRAIQRAEDEEKAAVRAVWRRKVARLATKVLVMTLAFVILNLVGAAIFMELQDPPIQQSGEYGTAVYFSVVTLSTIGYGEIVPNSTPSKIFVCLYIMVGLAFFATLLGVLDDTTAEIFQSPADKSSYSSFTSDSGADGVFRRQFRSHKGHQVLPLWRGPRYGEHNETRLRRAGALVPAAASDEDSGIEAYYTYDSVSDSSISS
ncbi:calcium-activated outward-rectifying potassium ion channel [Thecamonas trahens ATCC 50062]|uniref:Calcium-activated outward-rectifying potassium ion channel n=1 Tax=Thecamonas trahens ATCC 50062 TaxID=461836 RepID=A0A0L0DHL0_THETB|nr:calcium-activated outward-rectifying potassium ion channel [Thecamonas trahens ATCC 50062]KNC51802.1 calcium-activated outward-rectifying potassium ion channel [Thecamonas trahens ATCC 50062]|eukprot:XP_013755670.1 calcium-activated outward-rectifying potassium ion channel [Thecamonas trahens ATCC 50062]